MALDGKTVLIGGIAAAGALWFLSRQSAAAAASGGAVLDSGTGGAKPTRWEQFTVGLTGALTGGKAIFDGLGAIQDAWKPAKPKEQKPKMLPKEEDPWGHLLRPVAAAPVVRTPQAFLPRAAVASDYQFNLAAVYRR